MSAFRSAPRKGHLDRVKRICGYLSKMRHSAIRIYTEEPDYSDIPRTECDWECSVYRGAKEEIPKDATEPLGKPVVTATYVDAYRTNIVSTFFGERSHRSGNVAPIHK
jgi:hypothetical protein